MPVISAIAGLSDEMMAWRRDLHAHPETAFEEHRTAAFVADHLHAFGIEPHNGLGGTGVVGTLRTGEGPVIGLRADMDALPIAEEGDVPHRSRRPGKMHACGHDGHVAMLLGAAKYLAGSRNFTGTVRFVFQPAEELEGGAKRMVEEGLFERFPMDSVYGLHNWPALPAGVFAVHQGAVMASCDTFEILVEGRGGHGAMPHLASDPLVAAAELITALQTVVSRRTSPLESVVLSVTGIEGGDSFNVIPERVRLRGTVRAFGDQIRDQVEGHIRRVAGGVAAAHGIDSEVTYERRYPPTVNHEAETALAAAAAAKVASVEHNHAPSTGAEDFAFMLLRKPGCYVWMGSGREGGENPGLHNARYDFNDTVLATGASYWGALTETILRR